MQNPFQNDIFVDGHAAMDGWDVGVPSIHDRVLRRLLGEIAEGSASGLDAPPEALGRTILLTAPRAGYGKSHLLARLAEGLGGEANVVGARFNLEEAPGWDTLLRQTLRSFVAPDPSVPKGAPPVARLRAMARCLFGTVTARLIENGDVPSANPEGAASGLARNHLRLFAPESEDQSARDWLANNFGQLRPAMSRILAKARGANASGAAYWLDILREANDCPDAELGEFLDGCVPEPGGGDGAARIAKRRLADFCRLATIQRPLVFVFDHLDCFHGEPREGLRIAYLLAELRGLSPGQTALLAANDDLWHSAFGERLPSALADRLTGFPLHLGPLGPLEARALVAARCRKAGLADADADRFLQELDLGSGAAPSPRAVLRQARAAWDRLAAPGDAPEPERGPEAVPLPLTGGFAGGMLGEFGSDIPSISDLMDAETLRRSRLRKPPEEDDSFRPSGLSPFLIDPEDAYVDGPHSLQAILKSAPHPEATPASGREAAKAVDLAATLRGSKRAATAPLAPPAAPSADLRFPPPKPLAGAPHDDHSLPQHPVLARFGALREARLKDAEPAFSPQRLFVLVSLCGTQSPLIASSEILLPGSPDGRVLRWILPGQTLLLAFADSHATTFWRAFFLLAEDDAYRHAKLVAFLPANVPFPDGSGLDPRDLPGSALDALDVVALFPDALATLGAASDLIDDTEAITPATPGETLGILSDSLDFFWRRLTRPLPPVPG